MAHDNLLLITATFVLTFAFALTLAPALAFGLASVLCLVNASGLARRLTYAIRPASRIRGFVGALYLAVAARLALGGLAFSGLALLRLGVVVGVLCPGLRSGLVLLG